MPRISKDKNELHRRRTRSDISPAKTLFRSFRVPIDGKRERERIWLELPEFSIDFIVEQEAEWHRIGVSRRIDVYFCFFLAVNQLLSGTRDKHFVRRV